MTTRKALTYVELDLPYCPHVYGERPCDAVLGVSGEDRCFNTLETCQSPANFRRAPATDFTEFDLGSGLPSDFTARWNTSGITYTREGATGSYAQGSNLRTVGSVFGNMSSGANAFSGSANLKLTSCARRTGLNAYLGKDFADDPRRIFKAVVYGSNDQGYVNAENPTVTLILRGKNGSAPISETDGTQLASISFADSTKQHTTARTLTPSDRRAWRYVWVEIRKSGTKSQSICMSEIQFYEAIGAPLTETSRRLKIDKPSDSLTLVQYNRMGESQHADCEGRASFQVTSNIAGSSRALFGLVLRGSGNASTATGYAFVVLSGTQATIRKIVNGVTTDLASLAVSLTIDKTHHMRFSAVGTLLRAKFWRDGTAEPENWQVSINDSVISAPGRMGFLTTKASALPSVSYLAFGVNGKPAPTDDEALAYSPPATVRFAEDTDYLPKDIEAIPCIKPKGVDLSPSVLSLGEDMGLRSSLTVTMEDGKHADTGRGFDKYHALRAYNPYEQGTLFGKLRARQPYLGPSSDLRLYRGFLGQALDQMDCRHFVAENQDGPGFDGVYRLISKDPLKFASRSRAQAPRLNKGYLQAALTTTATTATLLPAGIGDAEYPTSGYVNIGGREICSFTRSGNTLTLGRAKLNTSPQQHDAQDRVQVVLDYSAKDPAEIIYDLLVNYAGVSPTFIDFPAWQAEVAAALKQVFSAYIAEPTDVEQLISELIRQAALALWYDEAARKIRLQVLRAVSTEAFVFNEQNVMKGSFKVTDQPSKRKSEIWFWFAQINPLAGVDDESNFRAVEIALSSKADKYDVPSIEKIMSRWVPNGARPVAQRVAAQRLSRFEDAPRKINFDVFRGDDGPTIELGRGFRVEAFPFQAANGARKQVPVHVTSLAAEPDRYRVEAEELVFKAPTAVETDHVLILDANNLNINLRELHDRAYAPAVSGDVVRCIIDAGVIIGSTSTSIPALDVGSWATGVQVILEFNEGGARLEGRGGAPGRGGNGAGAGNNGGAATSGQPGGPALYTRHPVTIIIRDGQIWGGGGGGGGGSGGGGGGKGGNGGQGRTIQVNLGDIFGDDIRTLHGGAGGKGGDGGPGGGGGGGGAGAGREASGGGAAGSGAQAGQPGAPGSAAAYGLGGTYGNGASGKNGSSGAKGVGIAGSGGAESGPGGDGGKGGSGGRGGRGGRGGAPGEAGEPGERGGGGTNGANGANGGKHKGSNNGSMHKVLGIGSGQNGGGGGAAGAPGSGGAPGRAVDGWSYVTLQQGTGDIRGPKVN